MVHFAKFNEAFPTERISSSSSSESIRQHQQQSYHNQPTLNEFNQNYHIKEEVNNNNISSKYLENTNAHVDNNYPYTRDNIYNRHSVENSCIYLINQVMQNETCKRILRNILLDEYMDNLIKQRANVVPKEINTNIYQPTSQPNKDLIEGFVGGYNTVSTIFGLDIRTLIILFLFIVVCLYFYDLFNRLFR